jgi:hypothetical protein
MALSKDQATAATTKVPGKNSRAKTKIAVAPAIDVASIQVSDDLLDQYADMLSPVPPPPIANPKVFSARVAAPIDGGSDDVGPESIGLGFAVGVVVAGEAMGQGLNILGRGLARLLR